MPAYHSRYNDEETQEACGCLVLPLKTKSKGPGPTFTGAAEDDDVIDEAIKYFRPNSLFRNFEVKGGADRTMIYLSLYVHQCLKECEKEKSKDAAVKAMHALAIKQFSAPGAPGWPLGTMFPAAKNTQEADLWKSYFKQCREEVGLRLMELLYYPDGSKNKWWQCFSKHKFMGKELTNQ